MEVLSKAGLTTEKTFSPILYRQLLFFLPQYSIPQHCPTQSFSLESMSLTSLLETGSLHSQYNPVQKE
jgi:hypothetical protein